jgi:hypothetical protein
MFLLVFFIPHTSYCSNNSNNKTHSGKNDVASTSKPIPSQPFMQLVAWQASMINIRMQRIETELQRVLGDQIKRRLEESWILVFPASQHHFGQL